ncbi:MAG: BrnT family toxin [Planctomycetes bacterium]|nr:BrnT family toxin [Planctomycetota bacterium]
MWIEDLIWTDSNLEHIARHHVEQREVEEVMLSSPLARKGRGEDRYYFYGQTGAGRYLTVIADHEGEGWYYVVTVRDMTSEERRGYRKSRSRK